MDRSEIVFFDVETTYPDPVVIVEFGAILICPNTFTELGRYSTLVRPADPSVIPTVMRSNGITPDNLARAPTFAGIADVVYELLHGRIWAGHNIIEHDIIQIVKEFSELNRPLPEPKDIIDTLPLLTDTFGRRAGDMKLATLAEYFKLGPQTHRSLEDVLMNLEVIKHCATVLFLERSLPGASTVNNSADATTSHSNETGLPDRPHPQQHFFTFGPFRYEKKRETIERAQMFSSAALSEAYPTIFAVLKPDEISIPCLSASLVQSDHCGCGDPKIQLLHKGVPFQLCCNDLKIRYGINGKFQDYAGLPKLSFVVDLPPSQTLCKVLDDCDKKTNRLCWESGSSSEWRPVITEYGFNYPTARLQIPTAECGDVAIYAAEIYEREPSTGTVKRLVFDKFDVEEIGSLFRAGTFVDAVFSLESYDYRQTAGIRLIAKGLTIHAR